MRFTFLLLLPFLGQISCNNGQEKANKTSNESPRIPRVTSILSPSSNQLFTIGEEIEFNINSKKPIDSIIFDTNSEELHYQKSDFTWSSKEANTGVKKFKIQVFFGEKSETHYPRIRLLSDIVPEQLSYKIIEQYPHDDEAYTQGLFFKDNMLFESTGQTGRSTIRKVNLNTGEPIKQVNIDSKYFGEGSTTWEDKIIMLTYRSNIGFVFNSNLEQTGTFNYTHEGWGITAIGDTLVVSDGTETLHLLDPRDFSEIGKIEVYNNKEPIQAINELEHINGLIYANIYTKDDIAVIDPKSGKVLQMIDMSGLLTQSQKKGLDEVNDVLNGIAFHQETGKIYVTGKDWPALFEVAFIEKKSSL